MAMKIMRDLCTACGDCSSVCPTDAIIQFKGVYKIEAETCTECDGAEIPQCLDTCMEDGCIVPA